MESQREGQLASTGGQSQTLAAPSPRMIYPDESPTCSNQIWISIRTGIAKRIAGGDPPISVEMATWSKAGELDRGVKEHRPRLEWFGRVRGKDSRQRWVKASDLRPATPSS